MNINNGFFGYINNNNNGSESSSPIDLSNYLTKNNNEPYALNGYWGADAYKPVFKSFFEENSEYKVGYYNVFKQNIGAGGVLTSYDLGTVESAIGLILTGYINSDYKIEDNDGNPYLVKYKMLKDSIIRFRMPQQKYMNQYFPNENKDVFYSFMGRDNIKYIDVEVFFQKGNYEFDSSMAYGTIKLNGGEYVYEFQNLKVTQTSDNILDKSRIPYTYKETVTVETITEEHICCEYVSKKTIDNMFTFDESGNLVVTLNGISKTFTPN